VKERNRQKKGNDFGIKENSFHPVPVEPSLWTESGKQFQTWSRLLRLGSKADIKRDERAITRT
jgi:hypothetical protein